jgi:hypothetical protein
MRELKNLDCSISPVKCQHRRGFLGLKMFLYFLLVLFIGFLLVMF